ncbi:hypothetical protein HY212_02285 [Candidatus Pacearchaeota archaeon]|nr:hypothetical protein [Candidatus Pacearchaeota archaeon]
MAKKVGIVLMGLFVILFSGANLFLYFSNGKGSYQALSGMVTRNVVLENMNISLVAFILQWIILLLIVMFSYSKFIKQKKIEDISHDELPKIKDSEGLDTELDTLYQLLNEKERLSIGAIAKAFNVQKEKALEWSKILEEHDLVTIEYPAFNDPEVEVKEKKINIKNEPFEK